MARTHILPQLFELLVLRRILLVIHVNLVDFVQVFGAIRQLQHELGINLVRLVRVRLIKVVLDIVQIGRLLVVHLVIIDILVRILVVGVLAWSLSALPAFLELLVDFGLHLVNHVVGGLLHLGRFHDLYAAHNHFAAVRRLHFDTILALLVHLDLANVVDEHVLQHHAFVLVQVALSIDPFLLVLLEALQLLLIVARLLVQIAQCQLQSFFQVCDLALQLLNDLVVSHRRFALSRFLELTLQRLNERLFVGDRLSQLAHLFLCSLQLVPGILQLALRLVQICVASARAAR
mmetsp:Transcript_621/g.1190  ORF Transcript_621/g.1190 Transcript_621/m.1190 type:complete len:290 (+) Transcript_621:1851-2720(+)